jgi:hypothetical protein
MAGVKSRKLDSVIKVLRSSCVCGYKVAGKAERKTVSLQNPISD